MPDPTTSSNDDATVTRQPVKLSAHRHFVQGRPCGIYFYVPHDTLGFSILFNITQRDTPTSRRIPCYAYPSPLPQYSIFAITTKPPMRKSLLTTTTTHSLSLRHVKRRNHIRLYVPCTLIPVPPDLPTVPGTNTYSYFHGEAIHYQPCVSGKPVGDPTITYVLTFDSSETRAVTEAQSRACAVQGTRCSGSSEQGDS